MRRPDWQTRFAAFVAERQEMPFAWGRNDCVLFAADAVQALTGRDLAQGKRDYQTARQAARMVRRHGGLRQIASDALGQEVPTALAGVGDVVLVANDGRECLAVCNGATVIGPGAVGVAVVGMNAALAAWRV